MVYSQHFDPHLPHLFKNPELLSWIHEKGIRAPISIGHGVNPGCNSIFTSQDTTGFIGIFGLRMPYYGVEVCPF